MISSSPLDDLYFYQSKHTGEASSTAVSIRQLCKILSTKTTHVAPETLVWSPSSSDSKWTPLQEITILKEASAEWYYTTKTSNNSVGPVDVKQLQRHELDICVVYSAQLADKGWFRITEHPDLVLAMLAFEHVAPPVDEKPQEEEEETNQQTATTSETEGDADEVQRELEAFLRSTHSSVDDQKDDEEEGYESDGGTNYVKDPISGKWIHEKLAPQKPSSSSHGGKKPPAQQQQKQQQQSLLPNKKKRTRAKFSNRNAKCWIYVTGLPLDTNEDEVQQVFSKAGILDLDSETQKPKVKLYSTMERDTRVLKGDASLCFARPESIDLCIQLFHEAPFRLEDLTSTITVERAKFEQRGDAYQQKAQSWQKRKVAKTAALQSVGWEDNVDNGRITGGLKGLTIVVLKHMFTPQQARDDKFLEELERKTRTECSEWGTATKITVFASNPKGIILVRFKEPTAATTAVEKFNGRTSGETKIEAHFWDGVTDYTVKDYDKEKHQDEERHEEFGEWLDTQHELPEELRLQVES
jgi:HIV Tat-specific factor 1